MFDEIENKLRVVGATAIEDKLQEDVSHVIDFIKRANIKVWVLTGDKLETAMNIAVSSGIINNNETVIHTLNDCQFEIA